MSLMKKPLYPTAACVLATLASSALAQVNLDGNPYRQSFDSLGAGLPAGWSLWTGATATSPGIATGFTSGAYAWSGTGGGFHNYASTDGHTSTMTASAQMAATDRALGVRQTASFGDPGAAWVLQIANTSGHRDFEFVFSFQVLDEESRATTWTADYALGDAPASFVPLGVFTRAAWGSQLENYALPASVNHQDQPLWIRLAALDTSTGSQSRDAFALDDFELRYRAVAPVPEPAVFGLAMGLASLGLAWRGSRLGRC
jgi:hypothetical protein